MINYSCLAIWYTVHSLGDDQHVDHFCSELGWREFSYSQLYHHPDLPTFNTVTQGQKIDPAGDYVRKWLPEIRTTQ